MDSIKLKKVKNFLKSGPNCTTFNCNSPLPFKNVFSANTRLMKANPRCTSWQPHSAPMPSEYTFMKIPRHRPANEIRSPTLRMPDSTAPHLKYGLFPNKGSSPRPYHKAAKRNDSPVNRSISVCQKAEHNAPLLSPVQNTMQNTGHVKQTKQDKIKHKNGRLAMAPIIAYQPTGNRLEHKLSLSKMMHLDIKPRKSPTSLLKSPTSILFPSSLRMVMSPNGRANRSMVPTKL